MPRTNEWNKIDALIMGAAALRADAESASSGGPLADPAAAARDRAAADVLAALAVERSRRVARGAVSAENRQWLAAVGIALRGATSGA